MDGGYNEGAIQVAGKYIRGGINGIRFDPNGDPTDNYEVVIEEDGSVSFQTNGRIRFNTGTSKMQFSVDGGATWSDLGRGGFIASATAPDDPVDGETVWTDVVNNQVKLWYSGEWMVLHTLTVVLNFLLQEDDSSFYLLEDGTSKLAMG